MFARGAGAAAALVGFAGPGLANGAMYLVSLLLLRQRIVRANVFLFILVFWFNVMNVGNFYDYVPIRTFTSRGDIGHILQGLNVSPWVGLVVLGIPVALALWWLFARTTPLALARLAPHSRFRRGFIVTMSVVIIFGYFGLAGWRGYGEISHALSVASLAMVPILLIVYRPANQGFRNPTIL